MFHSARTRLTLWYILIITVISVSFSALIYRDISWELERGYRMAEHRLVVELPYVQSRAKLIFLHEQFAEAKKVLLTRVSIVNLFIITISGIASYFLAGKTLRPLEEAIDEQKRFVSDASHELRTPLTTLRSEIEVSLRDKKLTPSDTRLLLKSNLEEVQKMQGLINYLLSLSRSEKMREVSPKEKFNLSSVIENLTQKYQMQAKKKGVSLTTDLKQVTVKAHKTSIEELIGILIDNAIKYTPKGGSITVSTFMKNRRVNIKIADTGIGISEEDLPHIFDRFYRADTSRSKQSSDGYGLGLAIAKAIAVSHKGEIKVKSKPGKGTTFTVIL